MTDAVWTPLSRVEEDAEDVARFSLAEDGPEDVTSEFTVAEDQAGRGRIEFRSTGVLAGLAYADAVGRQAGFGALAWGAAEGERIAGPRVVGTLEGPLRAILAGERTLLNLLQRASGIATATRACVDAVAHTGCRVLHTRKTVPGLRLFDAAAVVAGGGQLHRLDLAHQVMVKDNHWRALRQGGGTLAEALRLAANWEITALYVEVESEEQLREACAAGASRLLVDNQSPATVRAWAAQARALRPGIEIEATGGIGPANVVAYAEAGADFVSIGALTHSVQAADVGLEIE
ncbi:MAG TPA: carboxylating nicotinate-nucleotide diphosphorylase [Gemmatimonadales bacterium]|nr:carboxylating nicotinate-nucleotide diphosphorylase [Gemmatimonadales bacterium]